MKKVILSVVLLLFVNITAHAEQGTVDQIQKAVTNLTDYSEKISGDCSEQEALQILAGYLQLNDFDPEQQAGLPCKTDKKEN